MQQHKARHLNPQTLVAIRRPAPGARRQYTTALAKEMSIRESPYMADLIEFVAKAEERRLVRLEQMRRTSDYVAAIRAERAVRRQLTSSSRKERSKRKSGP